MPRKVRNTVILAKVETTSGTDAAPTGGSNAIFISNASFEYLYNNVDRDLIRGYLGASEQLAGSRFMRATFDVEISGSGTAGTAPAWGPLLQGCAMAETISAGSRVEYNPITASMQTLTIYYYDDGVLRKALGCMGNVELAMGEGDRPLFKFSFLGVDGGTTAASNATPTFTAWKVPLVITDPNTGDIKLGGTYATGAITGGTAYPSRGLTLNLGNDPRQIQLLGGQRVDINQRATTGSMELELTAAQEATLMTDINANTLTSLSFEHGTTAGGKVLFYAPKVQRINPKLVDYEGNRLAGMDLRLTPNSGNDELLIVAL